MAQVEANVHLHRTLSKIREAGGSPSVALNPHTPAEMIENVLDTLCHTSCTATPCTFPLGALLTESMHHVCHRCSTCATTCS